MTTTTRPRPARKGRTVRPIHNRAELDNPVPGFNLLALVQQDTGDSGRQTGRTYRFRCPNPQHHDNHPSFDVSYVGDRWVYNCRSACGGGDAAEYMVLTGRAYDQAEGLRVVREMTGGNTSHRIAPAAPVAPVEERFAPLPDPTTPDDPERHLQAFITERGWTPWAIDTYGLIPVVDNRGQVRIRFPWRNAIGRTIFAQDRSTAADAGKWRWLSPKERTVPGPFGLEAQRDQAAAITANPTEFDAGNDLFVTEGLTDCVALTDGCHDADPGDLTLAVGLIGGTVKHGWERFFAGSDLFVVFDNDDAGRAKRDHLHGRLEKHAASITHVYVPDPFKDVAEWRKAVGNEFRGQLIDAVAHAIDTEGAL